MEMNSIPWSPVLRYATPLLMNRTPVLTVAGRREVRFLRFAVHHIPPGEQDLVSTVGGRTQGRFLHSAVRHASFRLFHPSWLAPDEHDMFRPSGFAPDE